MLSIGKSHSIQIEVPLGRVRIRCRHWFKEHPGPPRIHHGTIPCLETRVNAPALPPTARGLVASNGWRRVFPDGQKRVARQQFDGSRAKAWNTSVGSRGPDRCLFHLCAHLPW